MSEEDEWKASLILSMMGIVVDVTRCRVVKVR